MPILLFLPLPPLFFPLSSIPTPFPLSLSVSLSLFLARELTQNKKIYMDVV